MPDTSGVRTQINNFFTSDGTGSISGSKARTVLLGLCDLIDGIFTTFLKVGTGTTSTNNGDDVYHTGNIAVGLTTAATKLHIGQDNPANGGLITIDNVHNAAGRTGAKIIFNQNGLAAWRFGMPGDGDALVIDGWGGGTLPERVRIDGSGNVGIGTNAPTSTLDILGNGNTQLRLRNGFTPSGSADSSGQQGQIAWDANYFYVKTGAGWKRSALSTF